ncbi:MAG: sugar porter family MFS transporter [Planctomycetia bacterium]|nr:sugar porter family MFS transporter [Planctomycetia bacterium]
MNLRLFLMSLIAALGGFLFGFDTIVINGTTVSLRQVFDLSEGWLGFTVASALIGTILGALFAGRPADRLGRKPVLFWIGILYFVSALGSGIAWDWWSLFIFRLIGGLGVGGASVVAPMYIAEISPPAYRGRLVALMQFNVVFGVFVAFISNAVIDRVFSHEIAWRLMLGVEAVPALVFTLLVPLIPRSPRWLMGRKRESEARNVLLKVGNTAEQTELELTAIRQSLDLAHHTSSEPLFRKSYLAPIMLAVLIAMFNQLSGINAVMYYMSDIFQMAGSRTDSALFQSCLIGAINLITTLCGLLLIDRFGRKFLMYAGSIGYIISLAVITWMFLIYADEFKTASTHNRVEVARQYVEDVTARSSQTGQAVVAQRQLEQAESNYQIALEKTGELAPGALKKPGMVVLAGLFFFVIAHAFGQGTVIWVYISEIFPNRVRAKGQVLGSFTHWFMAALVAQSFPVLVAWVGPAFPFAFYTVMMILQLLWVRFFMIETRNVPLEEIQKKLNIA